MPIDTRTRIVKGNARSRGTMEAKVTITNTPEVDFVADFVLYARIEDAIHLYGDQGTPPDLTAIEAILEAGTPSGKHVFGGGRLRILDFYTLGSSMPWKTTDGYVDVTFSPDGKRAEGTMLINAMRDNQTLTASVKFDIRNL
ncbi:hypothetical protein [Pseudomonas brenneri]|uniref:hypothetical protein n=1 Tax=Pseudomonas brenneri TaxID=129817 RepID=UPI0028D0674C|nr:hypothetical protein [Pseudomonas brenneri]